MTYDTDRTCVYVFVSLYKKDGWGGLADGPRAMEVVVPDESVNKFRGLYGRASSHCEKGAL